MRLRPLAGRFAATLFTVGIVGAGFLAIPTPGRDRLPTTRAPKLFAGKRALTKKLRQARAFYRVILFSTAVGVGLNFAGVNPVKVTLLVGGSSTDCWLLSFLVAILVVASCDKKFDAGPAKPAPEQNTCRHHHRTDVRCGSRHVRCVARAMPLR